MCNISLPGNPAFEDLLACLQQTYLDLKTSVFEYLVSQTGNIIM